MKKTLSFILAVIGTILAAVALVLYLKSGTTMGYVIALNAVAIVAGAAYLALYNKAGNRIWHPYLLTIAGALVLGALGYSLVIEVETLGYLISGLRQWADVKIWAYFAIAAAISWVMYLVAAFAKQPKAN